MSPPGKSLRARCRAPPIRLRLPPYSPELNPIERLRLHLRDDPLSHCVFHATEEIIDSHCQAWNWLLTETRRIRSRCSHPWLEKVGI